MSKPKNHYGRGLPAGIEMPDWTTRAAKFGITVTDCSFDEQTVTFKRADGKAETWAYRDFRAAIRTLEKQAVAA